MGYTSLSILNETTLYLKRITSADGQIVDQFYLVKNQSGFPLKNIIPIVLGVVVGGVLIAAIIVIIRRKLKRSGYHSSTEEIELRKAVPAI